MKPWKIIFLLKSKIKQKLFMSRFIHSYPEEAVLQLEDLIENYPQTPQLYNYLTLAYSRLGKWDEVDEIIIKNYERHPEYLFAKSNYARLCLRDGNVEQIPAIFNHQFDLKLLYPKRTTFHVSEVIVFFGVMGEYYLKIGQRSAAELCYQALHKIDSRHEQTRVLKKKNLSLDIFKVITQITREYI